LGLRKWLFHITEGGIMNKNNENPKVGRDFEISVKKWFEENYDTEFQLGKGMQIGNPPKTHRFDIASIDEKTVKPILL
jgi:hypothetical protein